MYPFWMAFQPKECCVNSGKTASIAVKATVKSKLMTTNRATAGFRSTHLHPASTPPIPRLVKGTVAHAVSLRRASGWRRRTRRPLARETRLATQMGTDGLWGANKPTTDCQTKHPYTYDHPTLHLPTARLT